MSILDHGGTIVSGSHCIRKEDLTRAVSGFLVHITDANPVVLQTPDIDADNITILNYSEDWVRIVIIPRGATWGGEITEGNLATILSPNGGTWRAGSAGADFIDQLVFDAVDVSSVPSGVSSVTDFSSKAPEGGTAIVAVQLLEQ